MTGKVLTTDTLGVRGFVLTPHYNEAAGLPTLPEPDDRIFDFRTDHWTQLPELIGHVGDHARFSNHSYALIDVQCMIKTPQSDQYRIPETLKAFQDAIQNIIDYEHKVSPQAFIRGATITVRHSANSIEGWYFDAVKEPTRTYIVSDKKDYPAQITRYLVMPIVLSQKEKMAYCADNAFTLMNTAVQREVRTLLQEPPGISYAPFDIVRHGGMTLHQLAQGPGPTLVSIVYQTIDQGTESLKNPLIGPDIAGSAQSYEAVVAARAYRPERKL